MKILKKTLTIALIVISTVTFSCKKQNDWLSIKPNKSSVIPETLEDYQAIMDNTDIINKRYSTAGLVSSDNIYLSPTSFNSQDQVTQSLYAWKKDSWAGAGAPEWRDGYMLMEYANVAIEGIQKLKTQNTTSNNLYGQALFHRAAAIFNLVTLFSPVYRPVSASTDKGIPVRLSSDANTIIPRSSVENAYQQILKDATRASEILPTTQLYLQRPNKAAAYALLARTYLEMEDYQKAMESAGSALALRPELLDYNNATIVNTTITYRFPFLAKGNPEVIFYAESTQFGAVWPVASSPGFVAQDLYDSYQDNDLRKTLFYIQTPTGVKYRGTYTGSFGNFCGIGTNEVYLIRAECYARLNDITAALTDLNKVLINRFKTGQFQPITAQTAHEALQIILKERRKELSFVGNQRWCELRRLNKETEFQKTLTRDVGQDGYTLYPNDKRYVLPIPDDERNFSGIEQNPR